MARDPAFEELMVRLRGGDADAATEVCNRFTQALITLARRRLHQRMRPKVDPEDVLQSVYRSFFRRQSLGQIEPESWDHLWYLLTTITMRKCGHRIEHYRAARRNIEREEPLSLVPGGPDPPNQPLARDPTPSEAICLAETVEQLMQNLGTRDRDIFALSLQGYTTAEISTQVKRSERTVQRVLRRIRDWLEQERGAQGVNGARNP